MKAITIKQPWASLIVDGIKDIENRTWPTKFRGRVLIHSAKKPIEMVFGNEMFTREQWNRITDKTQSINKTCGSIIGSVEIVDCVINHESIWAEKTDIPTLGDVLDDLKLLGRVVHPNKVVYNWVLANPIKFPEPIPAKGELSFWDYPNILAEPEEKDGELFCHCRLPVNERIQVAGDARFGYYCRYCGGKWYK